MSFHLLNRTLDFIGANASRYFLSLLALQRLQIPVFMTAQLNHQIEKLPVFEFLEKYG